MQEIVGINGCMQRSDIALNNTGCRFAAPYFECLVSPAFSIVSPDFIAVPWPA